MAGLVALYAPHSDVMALTARLAGLTRVVRNRGRDAQQDWVDDDNTIGLGYRRLSVIDLSREAAQPMRSASGRYMAMMDGAISNYPDLHDELEAAGVTFKTRSDLEVLLAAIEKWGLNPVCQKLTGGFAIVLWDTVKRQLHLIRDHFGQKPLYFGWVGRDFLVASDLRVFAEHPEFSGDYDTAALALYGQLGAVPPPFTLWRGIAALLPGSRVLLDIRTVDAGSDLRDQMESYWQPAKAIEDARHHRATARQSLPDRLEHWRTRLQTAVRTDLTADVPVTVNIDGPGAALLLAMAAKSIDRPFTAVAVRPMEDGAERGYLANLAAQFGVTLATLDIHAHDMHAAVRSLDTQLDQPLDDPGLIVRHAIAAKIREQAGVMVEGCGWVDTITGSHALARAEILRRRMRGPHLLARLFGARHVQKPLPDTYEDMMGGGIMLPLAGPLPTRVGYPFRLSSWWPTPLDVPEWVRMADVIHETPVRTLAMIDRAHMNAGIETRLPLLRPDLFALSWGLPDAPAFFSQLERSYVPSAFARALAPVAFDVTAALNGSLQDMAQDVFADRALMASLGLDDAAIGTAWQNRLPSQMPMLWRVFMLLRWARGMRRSA